MNIISDSDWLRWMHRENVGLFVESLIAVDGLAAHLDEICNR